MKNLLRALTVASAGTAAVLVGFAPANASEALVETRPCASDEMGAYVIVNGVGARACVSRVSAGPCPYGQNGVVVHTGSQSTPVCFIISGD